MKNGAFVCCPIGFEAPDADVLASFPGLKTEIIHQLQMFLPVEFNKIEELLLYTHLDLIRTYLNCDNEQFIEFTKRDSRFSKSNRKQRASLLETNANSVTLDAARSNNHVSNELRSAFQELGVLTLELPMDYDVARTITAFEWYDSVLKAIDFPSRERSYHLKFKKLGTYKDNGFYSYETNTIIVDPREIDVYFHELGHLIYDRDIKINSDIEAANSEDYAQRFWDTIVRQQISRINSNTTEMQECASVQNLSNSF